MSLDAARTVLRLMIERLEPIVGKASHGDFAYWAGDTSGEALMNQRQEGGWLLFAEAYLEAKEALASGDAERIMFAALICPGFERDALKRAATQNVKKTAAAETEKRRSGGLRRGTEIANAARARWAPYEQEFTIRAAGKDRQGRLKAREAVKKKMLRAGFVDARTSAFPTDRTIAKHFPAK